MPFCKGLILSVAIMPTISRVSLAICGESARQCTNTQTKQLKKRLPKAACQLKKSEGKILRVYAEVSADASDK